MIKSKPLPPLERLQELFDLDASGILLYKKKPIAVQDAGLGMKLGTWITKAIERFLLTGGGTLLIELFGF